MAQLDVVLDEFHADLERAGKLLRLIKHFRRFAGSSVPKEVLDDIVHWQEATELADVAPLVRTDLPILSGSILLYICGRFEYFVREVVVSLADDMAASVVSYTDLPEPVRAELWKRSLEVAQNPLRFGYAQTEAEQFLITLAQNVDMTRETGEVAISSKVLSITESNMQPRTLADIFKRVNITDLWNDVGKQAPLKAYLSKGSDKECREAAMARLEGMMKDRNGVAHPTGATFFPDTDIVLDSSEYLKVLSRVLVDLARVPR
jgi:RiboL-PSP-HEPN